MTAKRRTEKSSGRRALGVNRGQLGIERVAAVLASIARRRQRQGGRLAGEVKAGVWLRADAGAASQFQLWRETELASSVAATLRVQNVLLLGVFPSASEVRPSSCKLYIAKSRPANSSVVCSSFSVSGAAGSASLTRSAQVNRRVAVGRQPVQVADE